VKRGPARYLSGMLTERWLVVGTDFSQESRVALARALRMAEDSGARVVFVHAYEEAPGANAAEDAAPRLLAQLVQEIEASDATRRGVHVEPCVRRGAPWDKILNVATEYGAELVIIGSSGQHGATRGFPLGSVASRVLALSTRCVLVARRV
jgi:nucleotide-binding universal stress UspA family protein